MAPPFKPLKVAVLGPKGQCGSCVVDELLSRGHSIVGLSRNPPVKWRTPGDYKASSVDFNSIKDLTTALSSGYDAIVCAFGPPLNDMSKVYAECVETQCKIKAALLASTHEGHFIVIGGAGSLHRKDGSFFSDGLNFVYDAWYVWPDRHLDYMIARSSEHAAGFSTWIGLFKWARNNVEHPGWFSWTLRPLARLFLARAKKFMATTDVKGLILGSRVALHLWEGVTAKKWSFLSPPWLLRDQGVRTGEYDLYIDRPDEPAYAGIEGGIYNEDLAVAIVDEVEKKQLIHQHWTCTGQIDLGKW